MDRFLQGFREPGPPPKRARVNENKDAPSMAQQHAFADAGKKRDWAVVRKSLLAAPDLINVQPSGRWSVLHQAAEAGNTETIAFLLGHGADITLKTKDGRTPFEVASALGSKLASRDAVLALLTAAQKTISSRAAVGSGTSSMPERKAEAIAVDVSVAVASGGVAVTHDKSIVHVANYVAAPKEVATPKWQVQSDALPGQWTDMGKERQALFNDAKLAGVAKAMFRDRERSYIVDLAGFTQTDWTTGDCKPIRLHTSSVGSLGARCTEGILGQLDVGSAVKARIAPVQGTAASLVISDVAPVVVIEEVAKTDGVELAPGQSVDVPGGGAKPYSVKNCGGGVWSCTCVAWKFQGKLPTNERSCKHIVGIRGAAAEQARLVVAGGPSASSGAAPARSPAAMLGLSGTPDDGKKVPALLLANKWEEHIDPTGWWISEKLDGMRAFWDPTKRCLFSRLGNPILCPKPFLAGLPDVELDGELFLGRGRFQELMSVVKNGANVGRVEGPWKNVVYVVFDMPKHGGKFEHRMEALRAQLGVELPVGALPFARCHDQELCKNRAHLDDELKRVQAQEGEGLMLRRAESLYETKRSNSLLKVKTFQDEEAVVLGHELGKGRNSDVTGALRCRNRAGIQFSVGTGLNDAQRASPPKVGEIITYRFFELTKDNKPRFPSFVGVRADADRTGLEL